VLLDDLLRDPAAPAAELALVAQVPRCVSERTRDGIVRAFFWLILGYVPLKCVGRILQ
jgi:hypothetical protein